MSDKRIPIILQTDIGSDIDDSWAIAMMLKQPQLEPKLILTDTGNAAYRAAIVCKLLESAGRTDVEVGLGVPTNLFGFAQNQEEWLRGYSLRKYPGKLHKDGIQRMIDIIMASEETITLVAIGPCPAIEEALRREPAIAGKCRFVGMYGSVFKNYSLQPGCVPEYNVKEEIPSAQAALHAPWKEILITPVDTCGAVVLQENLYAEVVACKDPLIQALVATYECWCHHRGAATPSVSSTLYDTVAMHMASSLEYLEMKTLPIRVTDEGKTVVDEQNGHPMQVAVEWKDLEAYKRFLVNTLLGK